MLSALRVQPLSLNSTKNTFACSYVSSENWWVWGCFSSLTVYIVARSFNVKNEYPFNPRLSAAANFVQVFPAFLYSQFPTFASPKISVLQEVLLLLTLPIVHSYLSIFPTAYPCTMQLISPESQGNGHRSTPCAWMSIRGQSSHWGHFHPGKKGCHSYCHVACAEPGRAGRAAGTGRCSRLPSPPHCVLLERRYCGGWRWCSAPSGWCGEGSSAPPRKKFWGKLEGLIPKRDIYHATFSLHWSKNHRTYLESKDN